MRSGHVTADQSALWDAAYRDALGEEAPALDERYVLATRLDAGASAAVWQAFDRKLGRHVAVKLFHAERARAVAEARAACDVISDHVVRVLDVHDGERPYIVMELIAEYDPRRATQTSGGSAAVLRPRDVREAVRWVRDVARGVHAAHLRDVFHRDLKPHNVLIAPVSRRARIADFGLAVTAASFAGTPEYMAPEQARGLSHTLDRARTEDRERLVAVDVWGLGALAYDLVSGRAPWGAATRLDAWELAASGAEPPVLGRTSWGERIAPRLRRVIEKAMALDPAERYASAAELGDELDAYLDQRPTSLDRSRVLRAWLWCRRNPQLSLTAGAAVVLATLTLASYWTVVQLRDRSRELTADVATQEAAVANTRRELASAESELQAKSTKLAQLQRELADEESSYRAIIAARDKSLHDADAATRALVEQLTIARNDRQVAELGRTMYEGFWTSARHEADRALADRDQAQKDRDAARGERDQLRKERDTALADRDRLQGQLDRATAELERLTAEAAASAARITALRRELAGPPPVDAGVHD
jgi:serine/threonine protein kinase